MNRKGPVHFRIHIRHSAKILKEYSDPDDIDAKASFWRPFLQTSEEDIREKGYESFDIMEGALVKQFPIQLELLLPGPERSYDRPTPQPQHTIVISVTDINYSSLDLGLEVEPISKLVELFDGNFEYFEAFLRTYVPEAFQASVFGQNRNSVKWAPIYSQLSYDLTVEHSLHTAFLSRSPSSQNPAPQEWTSSKKAQWVWVAANTSLLVPTILAAAYLWWASEDLRERYNEIGTTSSNILKQQNELIDSCYQIVAASGERILNPAPKPTETAQQCAKAGSPPSPKSP